MKNIALILASGIGSRCGLNMPKQFAEINGKLILEYSVDTFNQHPMIDEIIIVTNSEYINILSDKLKKYEKVSKIVMGGVIRRESSYNGVFSITEEDANVLIHDAARPLISNKIITDCINGLNNYNAICVTIPSVDTMFIVDDDDNIINIPQRKFLQRAQTPQCFKLSIIKQAHQKAKSDNNCSVTDDCGLVLNYTDEKIHTILGSEDNIKVTYSKDIDFIASKIEV